MPSVINRHRLFSKNNLIAVVILLCVYSYRCSAHLADAVSDGLNLCEYLLCCLTDHYYLIYGLFFYLIIDSAVRTNRVLNTEKIRYKTLHRYYCSLITTRAISLFLLVLAHLIIPFVLGITRLKLDAAYNMLNQEVFNGKYDVINVLSGTISNSAVAIVLVTIHLFIGITFISVISAFSYEIWNKKGYIVSCALILINTLIGFATDIDEGVFKCIFLNNYFILHHGLIPDTWILNVIYIVLMCLIVLLLFNVAIKKNSNRAGNHNSCAKTNYAQSRMICAFYMVYCGITLSVSIARNEQYVWNLLRGFSYLSFDPVELLFYIAPVVFSLFLINMEWENEVKNRNLYSLIRYSKREKWEKAKFRSEIRFISTNIIVVIGSSLIAAIVAGNGLASTVTDIASFYNIDTTTVFVCGVMGLLIRGIEWFVFYFVDRLIFRLTRNTIVSFISSLLLYSLGFISPCVNPVGKGSLYQLFEIAGENGQSRLFVIMLISILTLAIVIITNVIKKETNLYEFTSNKLRKSM